MTVLIIRELANSWAGRPPVATSYLNESDAKVELLDYVKRNWESEMNGLQMPEETDEAIEQYFADVPEEYLIVDVEEGHA